ncbi:GGDEF domain-containing protein [Thioalkalivibrio denitrificans]|uniref:diguanylate cyclase n=1 Tax=Thioalkalivibrio denitrificans TaxID=108003 RepID=A0A1V3NV51_9GAMM|nr:sensor domain-containing diguanylate cyclase [Thioalkalivibrio denitrificans]OOG28748.1 GGDEF domain-containing protein [Thioalkalivibrio denitrificans]
MDQRPLLDAYRDTQQRMLGLMDFLSSLQDLSALDVNRPDLEGLLAQSLQALLENQGMERSSVFLVRNGMLENAAGMDWADLMAGRQAGSAPRASGDTCLRVGEGIMGLAVATGRIQRCEDISTDERFARLQEGPPPTGSLICLPIHAGDAVLGVLNVSHPEPGFFDVTRERLLRLFVALLAQVIAHWRHVHQMEATIRARTRDLQRALEQAQEMRERYEALAVVDDLTGLHNRRFFFPEAQAALSRATRYSEPFSILTLDLDHFKRVNDMHGHAVGDRVLQDVAAALRAMLREGDILARFGGEEFVFALPETGPQGAMRLAERVRERLSAMTWDVGAAGTLQVTASMGVAALSPDEESSSSQVLLDRLLAQADKALYISKDGGRDRATMEDPA